VENEQNTAIGLKDYLQTIGYQVQWINNGDDFLKQVETIQPDLILLDVTLVGDVSGAHLLNLIRQEPSLQDLQVVMMGFDEVPEEKLSLLEAGAKDYLLKPIRVFQLESILMRYLSENDFQSNQTPI
jgi:DNA-binding response OmpR family regulator